MSGVKKMPGIAGVPTLHDAVGNRSYLAHITYSVWADEKLFAFSVNHAVGWGTTDTFFSDNLL
jgi:hypothetical protein